MNFSTYLIANSDHLVSDCWIDGEPGWIATTRYTSAADFPLEGLDQLKLLIHH